MGKFEELTEKLREIFQIDRPDLDFGIYRIIGARRAEIDDFLTNRLKAKVQAALARGAAADQADARVELEKLTATLSAAGVDPDTSPKVKELRAQLAAADTSARENAVFSHLLTFFSRYWDKGDFISQRRYKGDTYAIPYSGEEVVLHWANKDQYYTKSGELFANYGFTLGTGPMAGRRVLFKLVAADTAKDNRKSAEKNWGYSLATARTITSLDEDGETIETEIVPVAVEGEELVIRFDYGPQPKGVKQADLLAAAANAVLADPAAADWWESLRQPAPTEANKNRTLLDKHLADYAAKNTADYFIHKDLGGFLRRELDFYIKSEVMRLDDIQEAQAFDAIATNLRMIQCLREIALELITFLAQIEDFQKKLWLKKKFVVSAHWCVTLDRVPILHERIAANPRQWQAWRDLGVWEGADGTAADLAKRPFMMVDTSLFEATFRADLLKAIPDLEGNMDGLLVHGDNFQTLTLLTASLKAAVDFIYIDPPYNAKTSEIPYKNGFKHSSWISLMESRLAVARQLAKSDSPICVAIDENEREHLVLMMRAVLGEGELTQISVVHNPRGIQGAGFSVTNEAAIFFRPTGKVLGKRSLEDSKSKPLMKTGSESERHTARNCFYPIFVKDDRVIGFGDVPNDDFHPESACTRQSDGLVAVWPISSTDGLERKWRYARQTIESIMNNLEVKKGRNGLPSINLVKDEESYRTVWTDAEFNAA